MRPQHKTHIRAKASRNVNTSHNEVKLCTVNFTNKYWLNTEQKHCKYLRFISNEENIRNFYYLEYDNLSQIARLLDCTNEQVGYIEIMYSIHLPIQFFGEVPVGLHPKVAFEDYNKDIEYYQRYNCLYTERMQTMIDKMIDQCAQTPSNIVNVTNVTTKTWDSSTDCHLCPNTIVTPSPDHVTMPDTVTCDFNDHTKNSGFLAHGNLQFTFISPDRQTPNNSDLASYIQMARAIKATGVPNYQMARFPVQSNLNIDTWRRRLMDYPNKFLIQYLTFGFPLSLSKDSPPTSTDAVNHHSAIQYQAAVNDYLSKEITKGAILGPFEKVEIPEFYCSPLLTRPEDHDKRRVILNLSYPKGASLNDAVTRDLFDNKAFTLRFPTIDGILDKIKQAEGPVMLAKIDVARAFRNLRVDPADAFKFGIHWNNKFYLDIVVAFGWVHGSASFQMTSDTILYMMANENSSIFVYIDDFVIVAPQDDAMHQFTKL